jgi:hypothetical protein
VSEENVDQWRLGQLEKKVDGHDTRIGTIERGEEARDVKLEAVKAVGVRQTALFGSMIIAVIGAAVAVIIAGAH